MLLLIFLSIVIFSLNIPFGYWREHVRKFSFQWFVAIHTPVLFIILFRRMAELDYSILNFVLFVSSFFLGQRLGAMIYKKNFKKQDGRIMTACLVKDVFLRPKV